MGVGKEIKNRIAKRAAKEIQDGMVVNLGIGIPSFVPNFIDPSYTVMFQAENGVLGIGETPKEGYEDENLCNAGGLPVTVIPGASYFDSTISFGMIRRGLLDISILGALEVSGQGDLANWIVPGKRVPGMGGAIELAQKAKKVIVVMNHLNKHGEPKIVKKCSLPLTSPTCVDLIITDMAVLEVSESGLVLKEVMEPYTSEDVIQATEAKLTVSDCLKFIS